MASARGTAHQRALGTQPQAAGSANFNLRCSALPLHFTLDGIPHCARATREAPRDRAAQEPVLELCRTLLLADFNLL